MAGNVLRVALVATLTDKIDYDYKLKKTDKMSKKNETKPLKQPAVSSSSFDDVKFIDALFAEYNKSYKETKAGQVYPRWLDDEQLKWVLTVAKNCC